MKQTYHSGELEVQTRAGVKTQAARIGRMIQPNIPPFLPDFLREQQMIIASIVDRQGKVWASLLTGTPGFLQAQDDYTIVIGALPATGDPLVEGFRAGQAIGLLAIELETRSRMRINGQIESVNERGMVVHTQQVYGNCPKYIQMREINIDAKQAHAPVSSVQGQELTAGQQEWIAQADTFFIASVHPENGADASHRGGKPGFIHVEDSQQLIFPDYAGNTMFQTLGNISVYPQAGLLFIDFSTGSTLQVTGNARIIWDQKLASAFPGAQRLVAFNIQEVVEIQGGAMHSQLIAYSPFNPREKA